MWRLWPVLMILACSASNQQPPPLEDGASPDHPATVDAGWPDTLPPVDVPVGDGAVTDRPGDSALICQPPTEDFGRQTAKSADGAVRYVLDRCAVSRICAGGCAIAEASFTLTYGGRTDNARGADITYTRTHHNWNDSLVATLPDRVLRWKVVVDEASPTFVMKAFVQVDTSQGTPILPETELMIYR